MRILLTGASGFVGSNLAAVFAARGAELACPSHSELDQDLVLTGPPPRPPTAAVPCDTRLDATATAAALGVELPDLDTQLARLRAGEALTCVST